MPTWLLVVAAADPSYKRSALEVRGAKKWFTRELATVATSEGTEAPFTLTVTFTAKPDLDEALGVIRGALEEASVKRGEFKVVFSTDDAAWHEGVIAVGSAAPTTTTVSVTLHTQVTLSDLDDEGFPDDVVIGAPITSGEFQALSAAVRAAIPGLSDVAALTDGSGLRALMTLPAGAPPPAAAALEAAVQAAVAASAVAVVGSEVGAYVKTWDRTLFRILKEPSLP